MSTDSYQFEPLTMTFTEARKGTYEPVTFAISPNISREQIREIVARLSIVERAVLRAYAEEILEADS